MAGKWPHLLPLSQGAESTLDNCSSTCLDPGNLGNGVKGAASSSQLPLRCVGVLPSTSSYLDP